MNSDGFFYKLTPQNLKIKSVGDSINTCNVRV
jgi:hypothetical protein